MPLVYKQADKRAKPKQISHAYKSVCGLRVVAYRYAFYLSGGSLGIGQWDDMQWVLKCGPGTSCITSWQEQACTHV